MGDLLIREANISDINEIMEIEYKCFGPDAFSESLITFLIINFKDLFLVLEHNGRIIGYASATIEASKGHIMSIAILPEYRRRGFGEKLMKTIIRKLKESGADRVVLEVRVDNKPAISLYRKLGFKELDTLKEYYRDGCDALLMGLEL